MSNSNNEIKHCNQILKKGYTIINNVLEKKNVIKLKHLQNIYLKNIARVVR